MLSDRELASLAWLGLVGVGILFWTPVRQALRGVAGALLKPVLLVPLALFAAYVTGIVALASLTFAWTSDLLKDTVIWFITAGVVLFFDTTHAAKEPGWFERKAKAAVKFTVFLEFYLNFHTFSFPAEFALQAWLLVVILVAAAGIWDQSLAGWKRWAERLQALTGLAILAYVAVWLAGNWQTLDPAQTARELALPIWLPSFRDGRCRLMINAAPPHLSSESVWVRIYTARRKDLPAARPVSCHTARASAILRDRVDASYLPR